MGVEPSSLAELRSLERQFQQDVSRQLTRDVRSTMFRSGRRFLRAYRRELDGVFKTGGRRVAGAFRVYTAGDSLASLEMGVFTRWRAAEIYEKGGTITSKRGWLAIPVTPRAYTPAGRVRRSWRTSDGRFRQELFEGLRPVRVRGGWLLVRDVRASVSKTGRTSLRRPGPSTGSRSNAVEPVFLLTKRTTRRGVLRFFERAERSLLTEAELGEAGERTLVAVSRGRS